MIDLEQELRELDDEPIEPSPFWKYFRYALGIFLILLTVSYFVVDPQVRDVIAGFFESETLEENTILYGNKTVVFSGGTYEVLRVAWHDNQEHEFKACLLGSVSNNTYVIKQVHFPEVYSQHVYRVVSEGCPENTIIDLHSHPYQRCVASQTDIRGLEELRKTNDQVLLAVMCTEERISFYG